jgi:uncharacterized protein DUF4339
MSQGNDFANYGSADAEKTAGEDGLWYVAIASDDIKTMSLDQLDDAFRLGVITGETSVWTEGMEAWAPLREVAGLDDSADAQPGDGSLENEETVARGQSFPGHGASNHMASNHGHGASNHGHGASNHAASNHAAMASSSYAPPANTSFQSPFGAVVESSNQGASSLSPFGLSTAPVALNVDEDMPPMRAARSWHPERWGIGAVALCALGFALYSGVFSSSAASEQPVLGAAVAPQVAGLALNAAKHADPVADEADQDPATKTTASAAKEAAEAANEPDEAKAEPVKPEAAVSGKKLAAASAVAAPTGAALKGSVADALRKKPATTRQASLLKRKPAKKARATGSKVKRASASKSMGGTTKGGSAFDPLNESLP